MINVKQIKGLFKTIEDLFSNGSDADKPKYPRTGQLWYDKKTGDTYQFDGDNWCFVFNNGGNAVADKFLKVEGDTFRGNFAPDITDKYNLGSEDKELKEIYANNFITKNKLTIDDTSISKKNEGLVVAAEDNDLILRTNQNLKLKGKEVHLEGKTIIDDLHVAGTTTTVDSEDLAVKDNIIEVNRGEENAGVTKGSAGLKVNRGTEKPYLMVFDETDDMFKVGMEGDLETIASQNYVDNLVEENIYHHPDTPGNKHIPAGGKKGQVLAWSEDGTARWDYSYGGSLWTIDEETGKVRLKNDEELATVDFEMKENTVANIINRITEEKFRENSQEFLGDSLWMIDEDTGEVRLKSEEELTARDLRYKESTIKQIISEAIIKTGGITEESIRGVVENAVEKQLGKTAERMNEEINASLTESLNDRIQEAIDDKIGDKIDSLNTSMPKLMDEKLTAAKKEQNDKMVQYVSDKIEASRTSLKTTLEDIIEEKINEATTKIESLIDEKIEKAFEERIRYGTEELEEGTPLKNGSIYIQFDE